ncbi:MAG: hypothetical protein QM813_23145 [Verrucomicrobiota bacterium]
MKKRPALALAFAVLMLTAGAAAADAGTIGTGWQREAHDFLAALSGGGHQLDNAIPSLEQIGTNGFPYLFKLASTGNDSWTKQKIIKLGFPGRLWRAIGEESYNHWANAAREKPHMAILGFRLDRTRREIRTSFRCCSDSIVFPY